MQKQGRTGGKRRAWHLPSQGQRAQHRALPAVQRARWQPPGDHGPGQTGDQTGDLLSAAATMPTMLHSKTPLDTRHIKLLPALPEMNRPQLEDRHQAAECEPYHACAHDSVHKTDQQSSGVGKDLGGGGTGTESAAVKQQCGLSVTDSLEEVEGRKCQQSLHGGATGWETSRASQACCACSRQPLTMTFTSNQTLQAQHHACFCEYDIKGLDKQAE